MSEYLPIAVRAYTERGAKPRRARVRSRVASPVRSWRLPERVLLFDCETETDAGQALTFGSYQYCSYVAGRLVLIEEGLFYADDLAARDAAGLELLETYASDAGLPLHTRREFVDRVFWRCAYRGRAWVVGFNLPFDLSRLAVEFGEARGVYKGGHSLILSDYEPPNGGWRDDRYRPRVQVKSLDSKRAFIGFTARRKPDPDDQIPDDASSREPDPSFWFRGHFLDLRTLAFALTNESHSLASACKSFGIVEGKLRVEQHGVITREYIDYNRQDVRATGQLFDALITEYRRHPIALVPTKAYSPASVVKAYLKAMAVPKALTRQPDFPREVLGYGMAAYYGGRTECRIRRAPMPVVYVDFLSMYPTVNALMASWRLVTADRIELADVTAAVRELVSSVTTVDCFTRAFWPQLLTLVQVEPDGDIFPARADYAENGQWQIGHNPLSTDTPFWYPLADVVAAKLLSGRSPRILRAIHLEAIGQAAGLRKIKLAGEVEIDPASDDFFSTVIEQRRQLKHRNDLDPAERERLGAFLKVLANSGCYGIFAEINSEESSRPEPVTIYGLTEPFTQRLKSVETPGGYALPPLAACITAAARLMLVLLERLVTDAGGSYVFCDTDSMAIVATGDGGLINCTGGTFANAYDDAAIQALSHADVDAIIERFAALNPYDRRLIPQSILELEDWNLDLQTARPRQLYCYAISAKRYALYNLDSDGTPLLRKPSEHGLGHFLNPTDPDEADRRWIWQAWQRIVDDAHDGGRAGR